MTVRVYYSSASGGTNCVWAVKNVDVGKAESQLMNIEFYRCDSGNPRTARCRYIDDDPGYWTWYAGPIGDTGLAGLCIVVMVLFRGTWEIQGPYHCG